jgi:hypothetical protein
METFYNPDDKNMEVLKNPHVSKESKKELILSTLKNHKNHFYMLRPVLFHNYYYYVIKLFTEPGDEEIFREITKEVCKDINKDPSVYDQNGSKIDLFGNTFLSHQIINESPFNVLAQTGKFEYIDIFLDILKEHGLNGRMDVSTTDNYSKTLLDHAIELKKVSAVRIIAEKHASDFKFDLDRKSINGKSIQEVIKNMYSPLIKHLIDDNFEAFEKYFIDALDGKEEGLPEEDRFDSLGFTFVHNL